jgi:hypothetical protein
MCNFGQIFSDLREELIQTARIYAELYRAYTVVIRSYTAFVRSYAVFMPYLPDTSRRIFGRISHFDDYRIVIRNSNDFFVLRQ